MAATFYFILFFYTVHLDILSIVFFPPRPSADVPDILGRRKFKVPSDQDPS